MKRLAIALTGIAIVLIVGFRVAASVIEGRYNRVRRSPPYRISEAINTAPEPGFIADLHADSLLWGRNLLKRSNTGHVDVPRLENAKVALQVFSVVTTIPRGLNIEKNVASTDLVGTSQFFKVGHRIPGTAPRSALFIKPGAFRVLRSDPGEG